MSTEENMRNSKASSGEQKIRCYGFMNVLSLMLLNRDKTK
jgi:hypothetical protein